MAGMERLRGFSGADNTVLGVVATNVRLTKTELTKVAQMAHDGLARVVVPCHTQVDGDTVFALSTEERDPVDVSIVGTLAAYVLEKAVLRAVLTAESRGGLPTARDLSTDLKMGWPPCLNRSPEKAQDSPGDPRGDGASPK